MRNRFRMTHIRKALILRFSIIALIIGSIIPNTYGQTSFDHTLALTTPEKILLNRDMIAGLSYLLSPILENTGDGPVTGVTLKVDADDFVDSSLHIRLGEISEKEKKTVNITSVFNDFIASWEGDPALSLEINLSYYYKGKWFHERHQIPVVYPGKNHTASGLARSNDIIVNVETVSDRPDVFGNTPGSAAEERYISKTIRGVDLVKPKDDQTDAKALFARQNRDRNRSVLFGRVYSIFNDPLAGVSVKRKNVKGTVLTDSAGYYELPFIKGGIDLIFELGSYWEEELSFNIMEERPVEVDNVLLIPRLNESRMYIQSSGNHLTELNSTTYSLRGTLIDAYVGFKSMKPAKVIDSYCPSFIYVPAEDSLPYRCGFSVHRAVRLDVGRAKNIIGYSTVQLKNFVAAGDEYAVTVKPIQEGKAYRIIVKDDLPPGNYTISNIMGRRMSLDIVSVDTPFIYPFMLRDYKAPRLLTDHSVDCPIIISGSITGDEENGETVIANIKLENIARAWYLVTVESDPFKNSKGETMNPILLPENVELAFMMGPPPDGENAGFIEFTNLRFRRDTFLKFKVKRFNDVAALYTVLDMVYRGILGQRLNVEDLASYQKIADHIGMISDNMLVQSSGLVRAVTDNDWKATSKILFRLNKNIIKEFTKIAVKKGEVSKSFGEKILSVLGTVQTIGQAFIAAENMKLMGELAGFTIDAPLDGVCMLYAE